MKTNFFLKELTVILVIKMVLLFIIWWNFFATPIVPDKSDFANVVFGQGAKSDQ